MYVRIQVRIIVKNVTGFAKTQHNDARTEIQFIAYYYTNMKATLQTHQ